ncbi:hypothetical protein [Nocardia amikacinitolerans]|uniref:hypothetical protein n=1 Tax=Nocardia amikacinitolerans TaxID=756689 RepID=UPI0012ED1DC4|nr:hypothetical protein [Nocardia amikacinitolerans]
MAKYTEEEIAIAVEMAGDIGIAATRRTLQYPSSWNTLYRWCKDRGVEIELSELKSKAAHYNCFYQDTEQQIALQDLIDRAREMMNDPNLSPEQLDKLSNTIKKSIEMIRVINGKANNYQAKEDTTELEALKLYDSWKNGSDTK